MGRYDVRSGFVGTCEDFGFYSECDGGPVEALEQRRVMF